MELLIDQLINQYNTLYNFVTERNFKLQELSKASREEIIKNNPSWDQNKDARFTIFFRIITALRNSYNGIINTKLGLTPENWKKLQSADVEAILREYDKFMRFSFFQFLFSQIESVIRIIMRTIDNSAYYKKKEPFVNVKSFIVKYLGLQKYHDLFKFSSLIRNSIHNNGMYFPDKLKEVSISITYRGQEYLFEDGKPISCGDWITVLNITEDLINALKEVIESQKISIIGSIDDPVPST